MAEPIPVVLDDKTEDWTKQTWDFWREDDTQIDDFGELCAYLAADPLVVATMVQSYPYPSAIPAKVMLGAEDALRQ